MNWDEKNLGNHPFNPPEIPIFFGWFSQVFFPWNRPTWIMSSPRPNLGSEAIKGFEPELILTSTRCADHVHVYIYINYIIYIYIYIYNIIYVICIYIYIHYIYIRHDIHITYLYICIFVYIYVYVVYIYTWYSHNLLLYLCIYIIIYMYVVFMYNINLKSLHSSWNWYCNVRNFTSNKSETEYWVLSIRLYCVNTACLKILAVSPSGLLNCWECMQISEECCILINQISAYFPREILHCL